MEKRMVADFRSVTYSCTVTPERRPTNVWRLAAMQSAYMSRSALLSISLYFVQVFLCITICYGTSLPSASAWANEKNSIVEPNS
jgi:hypothetical protein